MSRPSRLKSHASLDAVLRAPSGGASAAANETAALREQITRLHELLTESRRWSQVAEAALAKERQAARLAQDVIGSVKSAIDDALRSQRDAEREKERLRQDRDWAQSQLEQLQNVIRGLEKEVDGLRADVYHLESENSWLALRNERLRRAQETASQPAHPNPPPPPPRGRVSGRSTVTVTALAPLAFQLPHYERVITAEELIMCRKILFCYRRYALRQRFRARRAVQIIWASYSRYRLRHKAPRTLTGDRIRKLHNDYKQDVYLIECPLLLVKGFQRHERILLGHMPHVVVYIRGLDGINQQQKDTNKKRLQKVQHEELEALQFKMNLCSNLSKKLKALIRNIMPGSSKLRQIDSLREQVEHVDAMRGAIIEAFGENVISADLEEHYSLGVVAILSLPRMETEPNLQD